jgi:hypothetical protein
LAPDKIRERTAMDISLGYDLPAPKFSGGKLAGLMANVTGRCAAA